MGIFLQSVESNIETSLDTVKELLLCFSAGCAFKNTQIIPDEKFDSSISIQNELHKSKYKNFVYRMDMMDSAATVVMKKATFSQIFLESYQFIYKKNEGNKIQITSENNDDVRIATLGLLFTTPNDTTAVRLNRDVLKFLGYSREAVSKTYGYISCFLSCNYDKTNKSSVLWNYFKRLHVILFEDLKVNGESDPEKYSNPERYSMDTFLNNLNKFTLLYFAFEIGYMALAQHPRNYYAANALRFFLGSLLNESGDYTDYNIMEIYERMISFISNDPEDLSLWLILVEIGIIVARFPGIEYHTYEWNSFAPTDNGKIINVTSIKKELGEEILSDIVFETTEMAKYGAYFGAMYLLYIFDKGDIQSNGFAYIFKHSVKDYERTNNAIISIKRGALIKRNSGEIVNTSRTAKANREFKNNLNFKRLLKCPYQLYLDPMDWSTYGFADLDEDWLADVVSI